MKIRYFVVVAILFVAVTFRILWVNHEYPQAYNVKIEKGKCYVDQEEISYKVKETKWLNKEQIKEEYGMELLSVCIVTMQVENTSKYKKRITACDWYIEGENYFGNGISSDLFFAMNEHLSDMDLVLEPGERKVWNLPFEFCNTFQYSFKNENEVQKTSYGVVRERYPRKIWMMI